MSRVSQIISQAVKLVDGNSVVQRVLPVNGGDINENYIVGIVSERSDLNQQNIFLKVQNNAPENFFEAEVDGLQALQSNMDLAFRGEPFPLRTPNILGKGIFENSHYLVLEYISQDSAVKSAESTLGRQLALFHTAAIKNVSSRACFFGYHHNNFIGRTSQVNTLHTSWISFFRDCRLGYQIEIAEKRDLIDLKLRNQLDLLSRRLETILPEPEYPVLVHGDLWGGNVMYANSGEWVLIDPAVYYGHPEVDVAMTELFGGFGRSFYEGYCDIIPREPAYNERKDLYNLYHMLNHLNLFGRTYETSVKNIVRKYL